MGHEPVVVAPDENIEADTQISCENGIKVLRVRTGKIKTASRLIRGFNEAGLSEIIWKKGRRFFKDNPCDFIIYYSPTIFFGALVKRLKKQFGCPSYLILRDIFPQWVVDAGILRKGLIYQYFKWKEIEQYDAADIIGVQSPANLCYFSENGLESKYHLEVLYNWTQLEEKNIPYSNYREKFGLKEKVVFFYGGNIGVSQDMDNIIRLAENLRDEKEVHFLLVGDGSEVDRLISLISKKHLTNITIHEAVDQQKYLAMLSEFDVGLISLDSKLKTQNFPGKMLGYMYFSMPILASINPGNDLKTILEDRQAGFVCINGEDNKLTKYALLLARDKILRYKIGQNARLLLETTFSSSKAAYQILSHFESGTIGVDR